MDKITAWIQDKKNLPIVAAIACVAVLLVVFMILKTTGVINLGGGGGAMDMSSAPPTDPNAGMPPSGTPGATPGMPSTDPNAAATPPADPNAAGAVPGGTPGVPGAAPVAANAHPAPILPYRKDPFMPFGGQPTKKDVIAVLLPSLRRPRIAPAPVVENEVAPDAAEVPPQQPFRRMAGALWNGRVSAILETNGETDIVRPGSEVSRGGSRVRVESITQDSITLKTLDTKVPMTIRVGMAGSVTGNSAVAGPQPGGDGMSPNGAFN